MKKKRIAALTLGCKVNYAETSAILDDFVRLGWELSSIDDEADLVIVHTCAVTSQAEQKSRQQIRKIIRRYPKSAVAAIGCYAQLGAEKLAAIEGISFILGTNDKFACSNYDAAGYGEMSPPFIRVSDVHGIAVAQPAHSLLSNPEWGRTRAFLKIQDGCSYGCSYCTIPSARGSSRSVEAGMVLAAAYRIAAAGYREIALTGVNIADYRDGECGFTDLLRKLETVAINRIRIGSVEPDLLDDELIELVASSRSIMPHFHLPLQSGSDAVLRSMGRHYDTAVYRQKLLKAVQRIGDCAIGADVMVGYPGESDREFQEMYDFISDLPVAYLHVFSCSVRPKSALASHVAAGRLKRVPPAVIAERSRILSRLGTQKESAFAGSYVGREMMVLFEDVHCDGDGSFTGSGYTGNYLRVRVECRPGTVNPESLRGCERMVRIDKVEDDLYLTGRLLF